MWLSCQLNRVTSLFFSYLGFIIFSSQMSSVLCEKTILIVITPATLIGCVLKLLNTNPLKHYKNNNFLSVARCSQVMTVLNEPNPFFVHVKALCWATSLHQLKICKTSFFVLSPFLFASSLVDLVGFFSLADYFHCSVAEIVLLKKKKNCSFVLLLRPQTSFTASDTLKNISALYSL